MKIRSKAVIGTSSISSSAAGTFAPSQYRGPAHTAAFCPKLVMTVHRDTTGEERECEIKNITLCGREVHRSGFFFPSNFKSFDSDSQSLKYSTGTRNNLYASPTFRVIE